MLRRRRPAAPYEVGPAQTVGGASPDSDELVSLLVASAEPVLDAPEGIDDRRRPGVVASMERLGVDVGEFLAEYASGRDYQLDHPLSRVDRTLDAAFVPPGLARATAEMLGALADPLIVRRLARYATRAAARARMMSDARLAHAAMRAHAVLIHSRAPADRRDDMVSLAPIDVAAREHIGDRHLRTLTELVPDSDVEFVQSFAAHTDVTLAAFGWIELDSPHGVWIVPDR